MVVYQIPSFLLPDQRINFLRNVDLLAYKNFPEFTSIYHSFLIISNSLIKMHSPLPALT